MEGKGASVDSNKREVQGHSWFGERLDPELLPGLHLCSLSALLFSLLVWFWGRLFSGGGEMTSTGPRPTNYPVKRQEFSVVQQKPASWNPLPLTGWFGSHGWSVAQGGVALQLIRLCHMSTSGAGEGQHSPNYRADGGWKLFPRRKGWALDLGQTQSSRFHSGIKVPHTSEARKASLPCFRVNQIILADSLFRSEKRKCKPFRY